MKGRVPFLFLSMACLLLYLPRLADFPLFNDEAIYIRWGMIIRQDPTQLLVSLLDGKAPLSYWVYALGLCLGRDPLWVCRLISVLLGWASLLLVYRLASRLYSPPVGLLTGAFFLLCPFPLFYHRLALTESFIQLYSIALFAATVTWGRGPRTPTESFLPGILLALGFWTKSTSLLLAPLPPLILWRGWLGQSRKSRPWVRNYALLAGAALLLWMVAPSPGAGKGVLVHRASLFLSPGQLLQLPWAHWWGNLAGILHFLAVYLTLPLGGLALAGALFLVWRRDARAWALLTYALLPLLVQVLVLTTPTSRYLLPHVWPWLLLGAAGLWESVTSLVGKGRPAAVLVVTAALMLLIPAARFARHLLLEPARLELGKESSGFLGPSSWSGAGLREMVTFLKEREEGAGSLILVVPRYGLPADGLAVLAWGSRQLEVVEAVWTAPPINYPLYPPPEPVPIVRSQYHFGKDPEGLIRGFLNPLLERRRVYYAEDVFRMDVEKFRRQYPAFQEVFRAGNWILFAYRD